MAELGVLSPLIFDKYGFLWYKHSLSESVSLCNSGFLILTQNYLRGYGCAEKTQYNIYHYFNSVCPDSILLLPKKIFRAGDNSPYSLQ
jgi:hypothetical protein